MVEPPCGKMAALLAASRFPILRKAPQQIQYPEFAHYASKSGVVDSVMREEVLVLRGEDGAANNGRDVLIPW